VAARQKEELLSKEKNQRSDLTPTGLLMEGHFTQISTSFGSGRIRSIRQ